MLVLSRKVGEGVVLGEGIVVRIVSVRGNQVRLAFEAPRYVNILREELTPRVPTAEERAATVETR
jgi:carbon storage regulator